MFDPEHPIEDLQGADYNPRRIGEDEFRLLRESLLALGVVKPIIASGRVIVAGHQRVKALRNLGLNRAPVFFLGASINPQDEVRFNQLHNGTDLDVGDEKARVPAPQPGQVGRFVDVPTQDLRGNARGKQAPVRQEICNLITRYGLWGAAVAGPEGAVLHGAQYLLACKIMGMACRVFYVANPEEAVRYLSRAYGRFSYDHLRRTPYTQTWAQMYRLRGGVKDNRSELYENYVLPRLDPSVRLLDFGCGQGDYLKLLRRQGRSALGFEPFFRQGATLDTAGTRALAEEVIRELEERGRFDMVVCDSVLNSVDSLRAEADVMTCLNALCRPGGLVFFSGRRLEDVLGCARHTMARGPRRKVEFLDEHGFSGIFRRGVWTFQKFHTLTQARALGVKHLGRCLAGGETRTSWQMAFRKTFDLEPGLCEAALGREFDLPWPGNRSLDLAREAVDAWRAALAKESTSCAAGSPSPNT